MADDDYVIVNGEGEDIPGRRILEGTDLELAYDLQGNDLVVRLNKGPVMILRVLLKDAVKPMGWDQLANFNSVAPDFVFKVGDTKDRMLQLAEGLGLDDQQLADYEAKLAGLV